MGSFCGTNSQTVINTASNPNVTAQQNRIYDNVNSIVAQNAADPAALVAPWNPIQTTAVQGLANEATANLPWNYLGQGMVGQGSAMAATAPYFYGQAQQELAQSPQLTATPWNPTPYESPYTQDVINATMGNINRNNAIQQNGALGNAISQGNAFGGDRAGIAMGELARNQALASNQTMAQLQQADFNQASQQANAQQQYGLNLGLGQDARALQLANAQSGLGSNMVQAGLAQGNLGTQVSNLGNQGQAGAIAGLGALYNAGTNLQNTQQQQISSPMTLGAWQAATSPGTGATPTSTTYPGSSPASALAGLGIAGAAGASLLSNLGPFALFAADGGRINKQAGGSIGSLAGGGSIVDRFHQMRAALQAGGAVENQNGSGSAIIDDYNKAANMPTARAYQAGRQADIINAYETKGSPISKQLAYGMLQSAASGGRQDYQGGGDVLPVDSNDPGSGPPLEQFGSPAVDQMARKKRMTDLVNAGLGGVNQLNGGNSPTRAPHAPGSGMDPREYLNLGMQLGQMAARGGTISGIGKDDGGEVSNDPGDPGAPSLEQFRDFPEPTGLGMVPHDADLPRSYMPPRPSAPPSASGFDPYRYMQEPNRGAAALTTFLRSVAGIGERGPQGLLNPVGNAAKGAAEGLAQYDKQRQDALAAALRARQLETQWEQQQAAMTGRMPNGQMTMAGENHIPALTVAQVQARKALEQEKLDQKYREYLNGQETPTPNGRAGAIPQASYTQQGAPAQGGVAATQPQGTLREADLVPAWSPSPQATPEPTLDNVAPPARAPQQRTTDPDQLAAQAYLDRDKQRLQMMVGTNQPGADALEKRIMEIEKLGKYPLPGKGFVPLPGFAESDARAAAIKTTEDVSAKMGAEYHADVSKGVKGAGTIAANQQQNLKLLETLMADPNFASGTLANWQVKARQALATAGINPDAAAPNEVFNMIMGRVLADQFAGLKSMSSQAGEQASRIFAPMLAIEEKALPHESDTIEGKRMKVAILNNAGQLMIRWANKVDEYESKYGRLDPNFDKALRNEVAQARVWGNQLGVRPEDEQRAAAELDQMRRGGGQGAPQSGQPQAPSAIRQQLLNLPDGVHDTPGGRIIKRGTQIDEVQGKLGTRGNPLSSQTDVTDAGQIAFKDGKFWRRTPNWFASRWEEVQ